MTKYEIVETNGELIYMQLPSGKFLVDLIHISEFKGKYADAVEVVA